MRELSVFAGEIGDKTNHDRYFLPTLVVHDQAEPIARAIGNHEDHLAPRDLPNIPFHSESLLNGHGDYANLELSQRKDLLVAFNVLAQRLPIRHKTLAYKRSDFEDASKLAARMRRDLSGMLFDHLEFFQGFDHVKVCYDNGQAIVRRALDESVSFALSKQAIERRRTTMTEYRLAQVTDHLCMIELAAVKYAAKEAGTTYDKFFGGIGSFKKNRLNQARRKLLDRRLKEEQRVVLVGQLRCLP